MTPFILVDSAWTDYDRQWAAFKRYEYELSDIGYLTMIPYQVFFRKVIIIEDDTDALMFKLSWADRLRIENYVFE